MRSLPIIAHPILALRVGDRVYEVLSGQHFRRFPDDALAYNIWSVRCNGVSVATINDGWWGDGNLSVNINPIRWAGPQFPTIRGTKGRLARAREIAQHLDTLFHDPGLKLPDMASALVCAANKAEAIFKWRREQALEAV
jgi:hypothetical protein